MRINQTKQGKSNIRKIQDFFERIAKPAKIVLPIAFVLYIAIAWLIGYEMALHLTFNGRIQKIRYTEYRKRTFITIKGVECELGYSHWVNYKDTLAIGDSAVKKAGTTEFILIKQK